MFLLVVALMVSCLVLLATVLILIRMASPKRKPTSTVRVLSVAGSGGHTTEMIRLLKSLPFKFRPTSYVVANTDLMSKNKITTFEEGRSSKLDDDYNIHVIPRSREVAQSWLTTCYTTALAIIFAFPIVWRTKPDLVLVNGPGTCIPICFVSILFDIFGLHRSEIIFVESICRVDRLSMSGKILYHLASKFYVHWPELKAAYPRAIYLGGRVV